MYALKKPLPCLCVALLMAAHAAADENYDIWVEGDDTPRVSCRFAATTDPVMLRAIIGGDYVVGDKQAGDCEEVAVVAGPAGGPVIGGPGVPTPIGPRCKCPETYDAGMRRRVESLRNLMPLFDQAANRALDRSEIQDLLGSGQLQEFDERSIKQLEQRLEQGTIRQ